MLWRVFIRLLLICVFAQLLACATAKQVVKTSGLVAAGLAYGMAIAAVEKETTDGSKFPQDAELAKYQSQRSAREIENLQEERPILTLRILPNKGNGPKSICRRWLQAARENHPGGQFEAARCFEEGIGFKRDPEKARYWYEKAFRNGVKAAGEKLPS